MNSRLRISIKLLNERNFHLQVLGTFVVSLLNGGVRCGLYNPKFLIFLVKDMVVVVLLVNVFMVDYLEFGCESS